MKKIISYVLILVFCLGVFHLPANAAGEYRTWLQSDPRWGSITFGNAGDTISKSGCALTSIAKLMVHSGAVTDNESTFNPGIFCTWLKNNGGFTSQGWIYWAKAGEYTTKFSYVGEALLSGTKAQKAATIGSYIKDGCVVVVSVKNGGHYVAVDKVVGSTVYIMDPANTGYTNLFDYDAAKVDKIRIFKGPHNGTGSSAGSYDTTIDPVGTKYTITSDDGVNLREGAGTSHAKLTAIPYNTTVTVTKVENGWGYTTYDGKKGWFTLEYAKGTVTVRGLKVTPPTKLTYLQGEEFNEEGMKVTALYSDGTEKLLTSDYKINEFSTQTEGECAVYVTYQGKAATFTITVTKKPVEYVLGTYAINSDNGLHLRESYTSESTSLEVIPHATHLEVTEIHENWGKVIYQEKEGWICLDYTKFLKETPKQIDIQATIKHPCILSGSTVKKEDFTVLQVMSDGTKIPTTDFTFTFEKVENGVLTIQITQQEFHQQVTVKLFDSIPLGDSNFDGNVNATDALNILKQAVGKPVEGFYPDVCELNGDQKIDAKDALLVLQFTVQKIEKFPIENVTPTDVQA